MANLNNLYRQIIMDHYKNPRNKGLCEKDGYVKCHLKNPSCGDDTIIQAKITNGIIEKVRFDGSGCSICCASSSVMTEVLKGKTIKEAKKIINDFYTLIKDGEVVDEDELDEAVAFSGVHQFPARVKCATLAWKAMGTILEGESGERVEEDGK